MRARRRRDTGGRREGLNHGSFNLILRGEAFVGVLYLIDQI